MAGGCERVSFARDDCRESKRATREEKEGERERESRTRAIVVAVW